jgi:hypothetical protein
MRSPSPLLAVIIGLGLTGFQCAYADVPPRASDGPETGSKLTISALDHQPPVAAAAHIELVDEGTQVLPTFDQGSRRYVLGQMGQRYQVRVVNPTGSRVEAVVSVDGLDAVDGRAASLNKRGYIVPAYGEVTIDGFRTSLDTVAAFRFSSVRDSYAARTRQARNVGVVGVAFFRERPPPVVRYEARPLDRAAHEGAAADAEQAPPSASPPAPSKSAGEARAASRPGLGTQFGESRQSRVVETSFVRADASPTAIAELRYDDRDGLLSRGIELDPPARDPRDAENDLRDTAQPFPRSRFAQPPPQ